MLPRIAESGSLRAVTGCIAMDRGFKSLRVGAGGYSLRDKYIRYASIRQEKMRDPKPNLRLMARRIREIRRFDLTQGEFARILGISQAQLLKTFSEKSIDWILTGEGGS